MTMAPLKAGPYTIPAGQMLMPSLTAILKGNDGWNEPEKFNPMRYVRDFFAHTYVCDPSIVGNRGGG
jgi:cytochrome P450